MKLFIAAIVACAASTCALVPIRSNAQAQKGIAGPASPASSSSKKWEEPTSFLGIKLGEPISLPNCSLSAPNEMCASVIENGKSVGIRHLPDLGFQYDVIALTSDGVPYYIGLSTEKSNFSGLVAIFTERYGPPHEDGVESMQNGAGATFSSRVLMWKGPRIEIRLRQLAGRVDRSGASVSDKQVSEAAKAKRDAEAKSKASAL